MFIWKRIERALQSLKTQITTDANSVSTRLRAIDRKLDAMAVDLTGLQAVVAEIKADAVKNASDVQSILDKLAAIDPNDAAATQATINDIVASLGGVKDSLEATNSKAEGAIA